MSCGMSMVKYLLFFFNLLCVICGIVLIVCGAILFSNVHSIDEFNDAVQTQQIPVALIVLGTVILLISFFGCCGAIKESYCMSMAYSILLFLLLIVQISFLIYLFVAKDDTVRNMGKAVDRAWERRTHKADYIDALQIGFKCCGRSDYRDYTFQGYLPTTCCDSGRCTIDNAYKIGCRQAFVNFWNTNSNIILYTGLIVAAIEFVGFVFAYCLANNIRNYRRRSAY